MSDEWSVEGLEKEKNKRLRDNIENVISEHIWAKVLHFSSGWVLAVIDSSPCWCINSGHQGIIASSQNAYVSVRSSQPGSA